MAKKTVRDVDVKGKKVLVRVDFNVPVAKDGTISDDSRIRACLPTIKYLIDNNAKVILCSHFGRPDGKVVEKYRLGFTAKRLSELLGQPVKALSDCIGSEVESNVSKMKSGDTILLENLRFYPGEESNDTTFSKALAKLADLYVDDAFGAAHRAHASIVGVAQYLPAVAGFLMEKEIKSLGSALENPAKPFVSIIGGAKVSDKLGVLQNIVQKVNTILIGGGMAATFLKMQGYNVGASKVEEDKLAYTKELIEKARNLKVKFLLPVDVVIAKALEAGSQTQVVPVTAIPDSYLIADIGPQTIDQFTMEICRCKTALWNGPMGVFEIPEFAGGTKAIAQALSNVNAITIVGGGSTAEAVTSMGLQDKMTHVSTGGGASLEFLEGKVLPGVAVLQNK